MAILPEKLNPTIDAINATWEQNQEDSRRAHLGCSLIGEECKRKLWYTFRWVKKQNHNGRLLRLFQFGHDYEAELVRNLRKVGITVFDVDSKTGKQFQVSWVGGHLGGSADGIADGILEAPKTTHLLEFKTSADKQFTSLVKEGVEKNKPLHYAQMQMYMHGLELTRAFYLVINKNTHELYSERIKYDKECALNIIEKGEYIINSQTPPERMTDKADFYLCKWCDYSELCHYDDVAEKNCRTCIHATPETDGKARWSCGLYQIDIPVANQRTGCKEHLLIPDLIPYAKQIDAGIEQLSGQQFIKYSYDDKTFINCSAVKAIDDIPCYQSQELAVIDKNMICDTGLKALRDSFLAEVVG